MNKNYSIYELRGDAFVYIRSYANKTRAMAGANNYRDENNVMVGVAYSDRITEPTFIYFAKRA